MPRVYVKKIAKCHPDRPHFAKEQCEQCYQAKYHAENRARHNEYGRSYYAKNKAKWKVYNSDGENVKLIHRRWYRRNIKSVLLQKYGAKCARCGLTDERCLQLDHVNNDGCSERRILSSYKIRLAAIADTEGRYQLLCANCNWIKRAEAGEVRQRRKPT